MANAAIERIEPAYDGLDTDSAPDYIKKTKAPVLDNFLVDRPGQLPIRGPVSESIDLYAGPVAEKPVGIWAHNNSLLVGLKANGAGTRDPWVAPYRRTLVTGELSSAHTTLYHVDLETRAVTPVTGVTGATAPGPRSTRLGAYTYGISFSRAADETVNGGLQRRTTIARWDGTAALPTSIPESVAPTCVQDVKAHLNRLFVLGGNVPGTTGAVKPNNLFWSDGGGPVAGTLAEWQDDVSGLINQLVVDSDDPSDFGVALGKITGALVVFKRRSIHVLRGDTPASFSLRTFSVDVGCIDPRSVVEYEDGVYFMSDQGYMYFDGSQLVNTTQDLRSGLVAQAIAMVGDRGVDGGAVAAGRLPNGYVGVSVGQSPASAAPSVVAESLLYHAPRAAWVGFTSDVMSATRPLAFGRGLSRSYLVDDQRLFAGNAVTAPETVTEDVRGYDSVSVPFTFDTAGGGPLFNGNGFGTGDYLMNAQTSIETWTSETRAPIPARWHSRLAVLAQPQAFSKIQRLFVDYTFRVDESVDDAEAGWYIELVDGRGNVLLSSLQVPSQGDPPSANYRRQFVVDVQGEANDAQLQIEWRGGNALALAEASVLSAYLTYTPAQERGSF